tara:strand:+ start:45 stop:539 length:495 start_codon:yes stop_codon:yes gene_type:complete
MTKSKKQGGKRYNRKTLKNRQIGGAFGIPAVSNASPSSVTDKLSKERRNVLLGNLYLLSLGLLDVEALTDGKHKSLEELFNNNKEEDKKVFERLGWKKEENLPGYVEQDAPETSDTVQAADTDKEEENKDDGKEGEEEEKEGEKEKEKEEEKDKKEEKKEKTDE